MAVTILNSNSFISPQFTVPQNKTIIIDMEATGLVDLHVFFNDQELSAFRAGQPPINRSAIGISNYYSKVNLATLNPPQPLTGLGQIASGSSLLGFLGQLPVANSLWYLVIVNRSATPIAVFYRVHNS